jgi:dinuclear metal center YbgI/SA1388 family protein
MQASAGLWKTAHLQQAAVAMAGGDAARKMPLRRGWVFSKSLLGREMLPKISDILGLLDEIAPFQLAESWDNSGLQVGSLENRVSKILMALDPTVRALRMAAGRNAQMLLTHHPLIFKPLTRLEPDVYPGNVLAEALAEKISVAAIHTNLDAAHGGVNDALAGLLHLENVEVLLDSGVVQGAGMGRIGDLARPVSLAEMAKRLKSALQSERLLCCGKQAKEIRRVAVIGGSGGDMIGLAAQKGADLLVTGDVRHHHALEAEEAGIVLIDGGHFSTEKSALRHFAERLRSAAERRRWELSIEVDEQEKDPVRSL